jgi:hypothetical protein
VFEAYEGLLEVVDFLAEVSRVLDYYWLRVAAFYCYTARLALAAAVAICFKLLPAGIV